MPEESLTSISFTEFNLESPDTYQVCSNDYVTLKNDINDNTKDVTNLPIVTKFCGTTTPSDILLQGNQILIQFHSNHQNNFRGFQMSYNIIKVRNCFNIDISIIFFMNTNANDRYDLRKIPSHSIKFSKHPGTIWHQSGLNLVVWCWAFFFKSFITAT